MLLQDFYLQQNIPTHCFHNTPTSPRRSHVRGGPAPPAAPSGVSSDLPLGSMSDSAFAARLRPSEGKNADKNGSFVHAVGWQSHPVNSTWAGGTRSRSCRPPSREGSASKPTMPSGKTEPSGCWTLSSSEYRHIKTWIIRDFSFLFVPCLFPVKVSLNTLGNIDEYLSHRCLQENRAWVCRGQQTACTSISSAVMSYCHFASK